jgi:hypothetical protein
VDLNEEWVPDPHAPDGDLTVREAALTLRIATLLGVPVEQIAVDRVPGPRGVLLRALWAPAGGPTPPPRFRPPPAVRAELEMWRARSAELADDVRVLQGLLALLPFSGQLGLRGDRVLPGRAAPSAANRGWRMPTQRPAGTAEQINQRGTSKK